jgi:aspartyl-tRNA(Asn)/glutamyl-tRNA(Gln) amidotransferase subunit A
MYRLKAYELQKQFLKGTYSATEITNYFLKRIKEIQPKVKPFICICEERALKQAALLDKKRADKKYIGKLAAIPIAIKDNMHVKGEVTTCGSKMLMNYKAPFNSCVVRFLEEDDGIIIGKTNIDEFAMGSSTEKSAFFPTFNPWDLRCSPGGSSGGSAAAIAARLTLMATGSDTGGSTRQPAALCGTVGFKPSYGRVSRYGLVAFSSSLDQIGPITSNVMDTGLMMEVIAKASAHDATSLMLPQEDYTTNMYTSFKGKTIGVPWKFLENLQPAAAKNFNDGITIMKGLRANIIDIDLNILKYSIAVYYILATAEASTNLARFDGIRYGLRSKRAKTLEDIYDMSREEGLGKEVKKRIIMGTYVLSSGYKKGYYNKAQQVRRLIIDAHEKAFKTCDLIAMPTISSSCFLIGAIQNPMEMYYQDLFTMGANLAGLPAITIPSGFDNSGKPLGLQLIGPRLHDVDVVKAGYAFEQGINLSKTIPTLFDKEYL